MHCTNVNLEYKSANKALTTELDRYKEEVKDLKEMQNIENSFSGSNEQYAEIERLKQTLSKHLTPPFLQYSSGSVGGATAEVAKRRGHVPLSLAMKCSKQVGAFCTQRKVSMVSFGRISPNRFLSSILLVVVIIITVVIVVVILVVVIFAIVEVVIIVVNRVLLSDPLTSGIGIIVTVVYCFSYLIVVVVYVSLIPSFSFTVFGFL
ncbi:hypothetical protein Tco_0543002 [Tanacetum coccineum]